MKNFPAICVDDFYPDPNIVRDFALKQQFNKPIGGLWPGLRTYPIHQLDNEFFRYFTSKFFSVFYNFEKDEDVKWMVQSYFQLIPPFSREATSTLNKGIIHRDFGIAAGVIYLNPTPNPDSGTSLYYPKTDRLPSLIDNEFRKKLYDGDNVDYQEYERLLTEHNDKFEESITFKNKYNRLIAYDSSTFHAANSFYSDTESRLIQVFFVESMTTGYTPLQRMNKDMI